MNFIMAFSLETSTFWKKTYHFSGWSFWANLTFAFQMSLSFWGEHLLFRTALHADATFVFLENEFSKTRIHEIGFLNVSTEFNESIDERPLGETKLKTLWDAIVL